MLYDTDKAYSLLTDEMKEKYNSLSEFENYINENKSDIFSLIYGSYKLKSGEDGAIFVIYNANSTVCITVYFDGFSNFKYDIKKL
jgi:hypothetical protein